MSVASPSSSVSPNSLEPHWMPFTSNREFKADPNLVTRSKGVRMWDHHGGEVLDGSSGLFCVPAGHGRLEIAEAVRDALLSNDYCAPFQLGQPTSFELAGRVADLLPEGFDRVFFTNSGSESIDTALKIVMAYHRARGEGHRTRFVSRERAYHGVNIGGLSLSGMIKNRQTFSGVMPNVVCMRHTHLESNRYVRGTPPHGAELAEDLERFAQTYGGETIAAVFVEPVAGSSGCLPPPQGYLERLREICDAHGIVLVFDEVICGFGRLGGDFGAQTFGVTPDIMTMAKALTNGCQPMGAVGVRESIYETVVGATSGPAPELFHGYTYSGHPAACAAGLAALNIYRDEGLFARVGDLSGRFHDALFSLRELDVVTDIRAIGLMGGVDVAVEKAPGLRGLRLQREMFRAGLHVKFTGDSGIFAPPFVSEPEDIDRMLEIARDVLSKERVA